MDRVLIIGYRQGLIDALISLGRAFVVWSAKDLKLKNPAFLLLQQPFPGNLRQFQSALQSLQAHGPYSHIIAGSERSVPLVALIRRHLGLLPPQTLLSFRCHDKWLMKSYLREKAIPMTDFCRHQPHLEAAELIERFSYPVVVKDRRESGGRSLVFCQNKAVLRRNMHSSRIYERFVDAIEYSIESFVSDSTIRFCNVTQYYQKKHINILPARLTTSEHEQIIQLNRRVIAALQIPRGLTHLEVYMTSAGPLFGELALRPPGGYIMDLIEIAYGFSPWEAYVAMELDLPFTFPSLLKQWTAAHVLHPGAGEVRAIEGWKQLDHYLHVLQAKLKVEVGDTLSARVGVGEDIGFIVQAAADYEVLLRSIEKVQATLKFKMTAR